MMKAKEKRLVCCEALRSHLESFLSFFEENDINANEDDRIKANRIIETLVSIQKKDKFEFNLKMRDIKYSKVEWKAKYQSFDKEDS